jgi:hypothetical protein
MDGGTVRIPYLSTAVVHGSLRLVARTLVVDDVDSGVAGELADRLGFTADDLRAPVDHSVGRSADDELVVELRAAPGGSVLVSSAGRSPLSFRRDEVPSEVLARLCGLELALAHGSWLHCAAVTDGQVTILVVGESGAGKSTVAAHLCASGFDLLSDEQVAVHAESGEVSSFSRPVLLKPDSRSWAPAAAQRFPASVPALIRPSELGARTVLRSRPTHVVFIRRRGDEQASSRDLEPPEVARRLCLHSLDIAARPEAAMSGVGWLASVVRAVELQYADSAAGAAAIVRWAAESTESPSPPDWQLHRWSPCPGSAGVVVDPGTLVLEVGAEVVLFHRRTLTVLRLNAAATQLWRSLPLPLAAGAPLDELWSSLAEHGLVQIVPEDRAARRQHLDRALARSRRPAQTPVPAPWMQNR